MGHKFCEALLRLGRGRTTYETNSSMPSEEGLEQLGACAQDPDLRLVYKGWCKAKLKIHQIVPQFVFEDKTIHHNVLQHSTHSRVITILSCQTSRCRVLDHYAQ